MFSPSPKEQKLLDQIEEMSASGRLRRPASGDQLDLDPEESQRRQAEHSNAFESLVGDLSAKTPRGGGGGGGGGIGGRQHSSLSQRRMSVRQAVASAMPDQEEAPFETLVTAFEAASGHLPGNLARCFQESVGAGASSIAQLVEQWVATEGPSASSGGGGGAPPSPSPAPVPVAVVASPSPSAGGSGGVHGKRRASAVSLVGEDALEAANNSTTSASALMQSPPAVTPTRTAGRRGGGVGLSTAAKSRLRNLLEQGITDFTTRLQATVLTEIEVVNIASSQVVARGGVLAQQHKIDIQELAVAKKEIARIHDLAVDQAEKMRQLEEEASLREDQFDILRQQLTAREEMLRESTATFRKELNRFRGRIADLEAELERRRHSAAPVVASWGHQQQSQSQSQQFRGMAQSFGGDMAATMRPPANATMAGRGSGGGVGGGMGPEREPDSRGVLAAAAAMDTLPTVSSSDGLAGLAGGGGGGGTMDRFSDFSFASPSSGLHGPDGSGEDTLTSSASTRLPRATSPVPHFGVNQVVQVASRAGMQEALNEAQKEFDKKLFAVKQRAVADKRQALSAVKSQQDFAIKSLKRDVEQRDLEIAKLKEQLQNEQVARQISESNSNSSGGGGGGTSSNKNAKKR